MDISLNKERIFKCVQMNASVVGRNLVDASGRSLYDVVRIQDRDSDVLESCWSGAFGELTLGLKDFVTDVSGDTISILIEDHSNVGLLSDIDALSESYMCNRLSSDWFKLKSPEHVQVYLDYAARDLSLLQEKLHYRNIPSDEDMLDGRKFRCCCRMNTHGGRKVYEIDLFKNMVIDSIDRELFNMYKGRKDSASSLQPSMIELHHQLSGYVTKYVKRITERIGAYVISFEDCHSDNSTERMSGYRYVIGMPDTWASFHLEQLAEEMHTYVVNSCLCDYLKPNFPDEAFVFKGFADTAWDNMKHTVSTRTGGLRKPLQPF